MNSFIRFDNLLIDQIFNPISEWLFSHFGITNFQIARYLCVVNAGFTIYEIWFNVNRLALIDAVIDLMVLTVLSALFVVNKRQYGLPPGTVSPFRFSYPSRFALFLLNIVMLGFMHPRIPTFTISALFMLIGYFMACDTPKGDRLLRTADNEVF